jgi:hypothetical protein
MPATVVQFVAPPGTTVRKGDVVILLEAMKMELPVRRNINQTIDDSLRVFRLVCQSARAELLALLTGSPALRRAQGRSLVFGPWPGTNG